MNVFCCPKCSGPYFGRDTARGDNGQVIVLDTVRCHNASDGTPFLGFEDWIKAGRPQQRLCGWRGKWIEGTETGQKNAS